MCEHVRVYVSVRAHVCMCVGGCVTGGTLQLAYLLP